MSAYAPQNEAEAALVAAWPQIEPKIVAAARSKFARSPWAHEAQERAEEEAQDAFIKCLEAARSGGWDGEKVREYVGVVASREVLDVLRRQKWAAPKRRTPADDDEAEALEAAAVMVDHLTPEAVVVQAAAETDLRGLLGVAMEAVPTRLRRILWLQVYGGLGLEALGQTLGLTEGGAKSALFRARMALRSAIEAERAARARGSGAAVRLARMEAPGAGAGGCRRWTGQAVRGIPWVFVAHIRTDDRYGTVRRAAPARRLRWALLHGPLAPWLDAGVSCGTVCCTHPDHVVARPGLRGRVPRDPAAGDLNGDAIPTGPELRELRLAAGLTFTQVAERIGCSPNTIQRIEVDAPSRRLDERAVPSRRMRPEQRWLYIRRLAALALRAHVALPDGDEVRRRRTALGLTTGELAAAAGVSEVSLWRVEKGWHQPSRATLPGRTLVRIAPGAKARVLEALARLERERAPLPTGAELLARRRAAGIPQNVYARAAGLAVSTIRAIERGDRPPLTHTIRRMVSTLDRLERERAEGSAA